MAKDAKGHGSEKRGMRGTKNLGGMSDTDAKAFLDRTMGKAWEIAHSPHTTPLDLRRASRDVAAAQELARGNPKAAKAPVHPDASGPHNAFPITLIGDKGHAKAQKATIKKLLRR